MLNGGHVLRHASGARLSSSILRGSSASFAEPSVVTSAPRRARDNDQRSVASTKVRDEPPGGQIARRARTPAGYLVSEARSSVSLAGGTVIFTGVSLKSE
jgi:hypothetical protein